MAVVKRKNGALVAFEGPFLCPISEMLTKSRTSNYYPVAIQITPKDFELDEADPKQDAKFTTHVVPEKCINKEESVQIQSLD